MPVMRCFGTMESLLLGNQYYMASHGLNTTSNEINVVKAEGWAYVETDNGKPKPGWVSTIPGSVLWMALDMDINGLVEHFVSLVVLSSYEHMGQAEVTCLSGCRCGIRGEGDEGICKKLLCVAGCRCSIRGRGVSGTRGFVRKFCG